MSKFLSIKDWEKFNEGYNDLFNYSSKSNLEYNRELFLSEFKSIINDHQNFRIGKLSMTDILSEVGDLCNKYNVTSEHLKELIDSGEDKFDVLSVLYDETLQSEAEAETKDTITDDVANKLLGETIYLLDELPFSAIDKDFYKEHVNGDKPYTKEMIESFKDFLKYILEDLKK